MFSTLTWCNLLIQFVIDPSIRDRGMYAGQVVNLKKASRRKTLARLRNMSNMLDEHMQASKKLEVQDMLKGLKSHMTLMLSRKWKPPFR